MTKFLARIGQQKTFMMIGLELFEATTNGKFKDEFEIEWKRGPQVEKSKKYIFGNDQVL